MTQIVTRIDLFARAANDAEGTDEREVVRFFEKRKLITEIDLSDVTRFGEDPESDFDMEVAIAFLAETPRTAADMIDWLTEEVADEDETEEGEELEEGDDEGGSIVPVKYRIKYGAPQNCGDEIALALTAFVTLPRATRDDKDGGLDRAKLRAVAEVNHIGDRLAGWEDRGLNGGLLRMNTSNILRGMWRRGEEVAIGEQVWPAREVPKRERKPRAKKAAK